jgi:hypothetical protein
MGTSFKTSRLLPDRGRGPPGYPISSPLHPSITADQISNNSPGGLCHFITNFVDSQALHHDIRISA